MENSKKTAESFRKRLQQLIESLHDRTTVLRMNFSKVMSPEMQMRLSVLRDDENSVRDTARELIMLLAHGWEEFDVPKEAIAQLRDVFADMLRPFDHSTLFPLIDVLKVLEEERSTVLSVNDMARIICESAFGYCNPQTVQLSAVEGIDRFCAEFGKTSVVRDRFFFFRSLYRQYKESMAENKRIYDIMRFASDAMTRIDEESGNILEITDKHKQMMKRLPLKGTEEEKNPRRYDDFNELFEKECKMGNISRIGTLYELVVHGYVVWVLPSGGGIRTPPHFALTEKGKEYHVPFSGKEDRWRSIEEYECAMLSRIKLGAMNDLSRLEKIALANLLIKGKVQLKPSEDFEIVEK